MLNEVKIFSLLKILKNFFQIIFAFLHFSCGLKPVPPPEGKFCDVWHKPIECIELDFRKGIGNLGQGIFPMRMKSIVLYNIEIENLQNVSVEVLHEHRVRITFPRKEPRLYLKIKDKQDRAKRWEKAKEEWNEFFRSNDTP
ncbi:Putative lipoprotein [Leptospira interrogans serovar Copenhageni/Icterohaemorrhagiae]|nr:Putative lipoprotein [Leptospira interrogans serovar Copenhageni/Icterohaemorrhagiae]